MGPEVDRPEPKWLWHLPEWFLAGATFVLATGLLVSFTYSESFGVRETGGDFFRIKYVHIGILCLMCHVLILAPICAFCILRLAANGGRLSAPMTKIQWAKAIGQGRDQGHFPGILLIINMLVTFYAFTMFAPRTYLQAREHLISSILVSTVLGVMLIRIVSSKTVRLTIQGAENQPRWTVRAYSLAEALRWVLLVFVIYFLDRHSFHGLGSELKEMFFGPKNRVAGGWVFVVLVVMILLLLWRTKVRVAHTEDKYSKTARWVLAFCLVGPTYYLSVLAFAFNVYPYIPVERGGGSFVETTSAVLRLKGEAAGSLPGDLLDCTSGKCDRSVPLIIIEETNLVLYVSSPNDAGGPYAWRMGSRPNLTAINRELVSSISYRTH